MDPARRPPETQRARNRQLSQRPQGAAIRRGIVAAVGQAVIHPQGDATPDDFRFRQVDERSVYLEPRTLDSSLGRECGEPLEGLDVLRPAVGITRVVERVGPDEHVPGIEHLGPRKRQG